MRATFTSLVLLLVGTLAFGQINTESPFPVDFEILSPSNIVGTYDYGTQTANDDMPEIWGPELNQSIQGEIVWANSAPIDSMGTDSIGCRPITNDLTGKIALIRRGTCDFSLKVYHAQEAGAIGCIIANHYDDPDNNGLSLVGMLGGDSLAAVTIPAIFISRNTIELIEAELAAGVTVEGAFVVKSFYDPISAYSYHTPLSQAFDVNFYQINYVNKNEDTEVDVVVNATITAPSGAETTLSGTNTVAPLADSVVTLDGSYLPTELGEYTVAWSNDQDDETLESKFAMTDFTFAVDNGDIGVDAGPSDEDFINEFSLTYQVGGLVIAGDNGGVATHATFGLTNAADLFSGSSSDDQIALLVYNADADNDGTLDFSPAPGGSFDDLTLVGFGSYIISGDETADELLDVELEDFGSGGPITLEPGGAYYIVATYNGENSGLGVAPRFRASVAIPYLNFPTTPLFLDQLYTGWADRTVVVRLQLEGYVPPVNSQEPILEASKITLAPNPVNTMLNVSFDLENMADEVDVNLLDVTGKQLRHYAYEGVRDQTIQINTESLAAGTYLLSIWTPEGVRVEKFIKQ